HTSPGSTIGGRAVITLYNFGPGFGLPDPSPFVTKVEVLLKMAKLPYRTDMTGFSKAPKGKLPYIEDDGAVVSDSTFIRWHIEQKYRIDFDQGLDASQKAIAWAFEKTVEDQLYWVMIDDRWMDDANFRWGPAKFFERLPAVIRPHRGGDDASQAARHAAWPRHRAAF